MSVNFTLNIVDNSHFRKAFLEFPVSLYAHDKNWIRPLDSDIENIFNPIANKMFNHGKCCRWILTDKQGNTVGRVAAFIDYKSCNLNGLPAGGMGFFECINNKEAAFMLFDCCKEWLIRHKMEAMDGPVNFGERHQWWGLLIDGEHPPVYNMPYHKSYYKYFFEDYGFQVYFKQFTYRTTFSPENLSEIIKWKAERLLKNPDYSIEHYRKKNTQKFIADFTHIYNEAWVKEIPGVEGITQEQVQDIFTSLTPIIHEKLMWFAYYKNNPIGFYIMIQDLNEYLKHLNGKITLWGKLRFLYYKHLQKNKNAIGLIFGVVPDFQKRGIESAMIYEFSKMGLRKDFPFRTLEMNWIGDFNPRMSHLMKFLNAEVYKTHHTYRKLFDESKPFKRCEIIQ